jgi:hypothetical protein
LCQRILVHEDARPELLKELLFQDDPRSISDQAQEQIEGAGRNLYQVPFRVSKLERFRIEHEASKRIEARDAGRPLTNCPPVLHEARRI